MSEKNEGWFEKTDRLIVSVLKGISQLSGVFLIGIMLVAFFNVLGEKILHHGVPMSSELIQYFHVPVVFLAAAYVTVDNGHTTIDLLSKRLPKTLQKICSTIGFILGFLMCSFVSYKGIDRITDAIEHHTKSSTTGAGFYIWPFAVIFTVGFFILGLSFLWSVVRLYHEQPTEVEMKEEGGAE